MLKGLLTKQVKKDGIDIEPCWEIRNWEGKVLFSLDRQPRKERSGWWRLEEVEIKYNEFHVFCTQECSYL